MKVAGIAIITFIAVIAACSDHSPAPAIEPEVIDSVKNNPPVDEGDEVSEDEEDDKEEEEIKPPAFYEYLVLPQQTDSLIENSTEPHYAYLDTHVNSKNKLLLFIGGTRSYPFHFKLFSKTAAALGYHVVNINYPNAVSVRVCSSKEDFGCFEKFREEILFGENLSGYVQVDKNNCLQNRIVKLLQYLHKQYSDQGWNQYYSGSDLVYQKFVVAGHSQGGGHAAYLAHKFELDRLIVLSAPNDYSERYAQSAAWCRAVFKTPSQRFYGLNHKRDEIVPVEQQYTVWSDMKMLAIADTVSADGDTFKTSHALVTDFNPNPAAEYARLRHNVTAMDVTFPEGSNGEQLKKVWRYLLE
jgi:hypothetical protein